MPAQGDVLIPDNHQELKGNALTMLVIRPYASVEAKNCSTYALGTIGSLYCPFAASVANVASQSL